MWRFDDASRQLGLLKDMMSEMDCNIAMMACIDKLGVSLKTISGRQRHLERLKWTRYLCLVPNKLRPTQEEHMTTYGRRQPRWAPGTLPLQFKYQAALEEQVKDIILLVDCNTTHI